MMDTERHVALVVEDDPGTAAQVMDLLGVLGYECKHAATQQRALELVEEGGFCFALLDLQIKRNEHSILAHVEAGQSVLDAVRARFGEQNKKRRMHWLPAIIMTAYAKETDYVVEMMQRGADGYVIKPFVDMTKLAEKIRDALERAERESHARCAESTRRAAAEATTANVASGAHAVRLKITGRREGKRNEVWLDDRRASLPNAAFLVLLRLVAARLRGGERWVHKADMDAADGWKEISRLRRELAPYLDGVQIAENDSHGSYRLNPLIQVGSVDAIVLGAHDEARVRKIAVELEAAEAIVSGRTQLPSTRVRA